MKKFSVLFVLFSLSTGCGKDASQKSNANAQSQENLYQMNVALADLKGTESALAEVGYKFVLKAIPLNEFAQEYRISWEDEALQNSLSLPLEPRRSALTAYLKKAEAFTAKFCSSPRPAPCSPVIRKHDMVADELEKRFSQSGETALSCVFKTSLTGSGTRTAPKFCVDDSHPELRLAESQELASSGEEKLLLTHLVMRQSIHEGAAPDSEDDYKVIYRIVHLDKDGKAVHSLKSRGWTTGSTGSDDSGYDMAPFKMNVVCQTVVRCE
jgi:hypothetical protein